MKPNLLSFLALGMLLMVASGSSCTRMVRQTSAPHQQMLPENASLEQVIQVVNQNGEKVQSMSISQASVSVPGAPSLRASLSAERIRKFRMRAGTTLTGEEVDIGSNDELFWIWIRRNDPPSIFYCRHDQFAGSSARQVMPVEPEWLFEAFGATTFNPQEHHEGPFPIGKERLQIRSTRQSSLGQLMKITVVDSVTGFVLEQHLYNPQDSSGRPLASSFTTAHEKDVYTGVYMPRRVEIQWPPTNFSMKIDITSMRVNALQGDPALLWSKPEIPGYTNIDLADPSIRFLQQADRSVLGFPNQAPATADSETAVPQEPHKFRLFGWFQ